MPESHINLEQMLTGTRSFRGVPVSAIRRLIEEAETLQLSGGDMLFGPGSAYTQKVYILLTGSITVHRPSGRQESALPGDFIGLANYLDNNDYTSKALATVASQLLVIDAGLLLKIEQETPEIFNALNRIIARRLRERSPDRTITTGVLAQPVTRVMKSPVVTCDGRCNISEALKLMRERKLGSLLIEDERHQLIGLLTFAGIAEAAIEKGAGAGDSVMNIGCETPRLIDADTPLWEAEELLNRTNTKYLIVVDGSRPIGVVSESDILRILISRPSTLTNRFREAASINALAELTRQLPQAAVEAQSTNHRPSDAVRLLSEVHLVAQRRAVELTLMWMRKKGYGEAPADYAILNMGSAGRKEMLLNPDQDNGIIIADFPAESAEEIEIWFERFCKRLNKHLDRIGYPICEGEIMAGNRQYRKSLAEWKRQISHIVRQPTAKAARWSNVVFDFDTLYGNDLLTTELWRHLLAELKGNRQLLRRMTDDDAEGRPAIGIFNQLITTTTDDQEEKVDIKRNGLRIIANGARILALGKGIAAQNTTSRLNALVRVGTLSEDFRNSVQEAYEELLDLVLIHQISQAEQNQPLSKLINPDTLSRQARSTLRISMRAVKRFQDRLKDEYGSEIF